LGVLGSTSIRTQSDSLGNSGGGDDVEGLWAQRSGGWSVKNDRRKSNQMVNWEGAVEVLGCVDFFWKRSFTCWKRGGEGPQSLRRGEFDKPLKRKWRGEQNRQPNSTIIQTLRSGFEEMARGLTFSPGSKGGKN